jgi:hypothetical protein
MSRATSVARRDAALRCVHVIRGHRFGDVGGGAGGSRRIGDADQGVRERAEPGEPGVSRRGAQHADRRGGDRAARGAAGAVARGGGDVDDGGDGAGLPRRAAHQVGPQELFLSRPAQGLPDQPVRPSGVLRRRGAIAGPGREGQSRSVARERDDRHHPRAPGRGRGQAAPRIAGRAAHRFLDRGLQPRGRAAPGDRHAARFHERRAGGVLCQSCSGTSAASWACPRA